MEAPTAKQQLMQLIMGNWVSQSLYGVAKLKVADHLASGPKTAAELADDVGCNAGALHRVLRALASVGVFEEIGGQQFSLTALGDCLREDSPTSARDSSIMLTEIFYQSWGKLLYSLQTGDTAFDQEKGKPLFEHLATSPEEAAIFDAAMISFMKEEAGAVVTTYQWPDTGYVMDVGGGSGGLIRTLLASAPQLQGAIFDLPEVIDRNRDLYDGDEFLRGCQFHPGDFFTSIPEGADLYIFRNIIHDWNDEDSITILKNCRNACGADSKVLILEYVIPPGNSPFGGKWLDLMMLVGVGGQERTEIEYRSLLEAAGFQVNRLIPTATEMSIIEAQPA
jgi:hypothetical protein